MRMGLLVAGVIGLVTAAPAMAADRDFSGGLTGLGSAPAASSPATADWQKNQDAAAAQAASSGPVSAEAAAGRLAPGNKIRLNVFGEEELSGDFEIDNTGSLSLPLVGEVPASGLTPRELERKITATLEKGYLVNPRVSIEVLNFRPFFILGEVNKPGSYPYVNDLNVINAVAMAGGYTTRAKTGTVKIKRGSDAAKTETAEGEDAKVYPGDVIRVEERFF